MNTLKGLGIGLGIGFGISLLIVLYNCGAETCALFTCSNNRPLTNMDSIPMLVVTIVSTVIGGLVGFCMDMSAHSYNKKKQKESQIMQMQEKEAVMHRDLINKFNTIIDTAYKKADKNDGLIISNDDYRYVMDYLASYANSKYLNELKYIYEEYRKKHITFISFELNKLNNKTETEINGINALITVCNHFKHYYIMSNNVTENSIVKMQNAIRHLKDRSFFIEQNKYGEINNDLYEKATMNLSAINNMYVKIIREYNKLMSKSSGFDLGCISVEFIDMLITTIYGYAFLKPFDATKYQSIYSIYESFNYRLYKNPNSSQNPVRIIPPIDGIFSKIIAYSRMGKGVLKQIKSDIDLWVEACISGQNAFYTSELITLSSGLMWLGEYELELEILRKAASAGAQLKPDVQERLAFLESGGSVGPQLFKNVDKNTFSYDYSSLKWSDADFSNFFKNITFRNTKLTYALAVSEFKKSFKSKFKTPITYEMILNELNKMAEEEYLGEITCRCIKVNSLSEEFEECDDAIIIELENSTGINHAAILLFYNKIGININVQILTVFKPVEEYDIQKNMKLAISLKQETSPKVTQTLESIRDSVARQIDALCDSSPETGNSIY